MADPPPTQPASVAAVSRQVQALSSQVQGLAGVVQGLRNDVQGASERLALIGTDVAYVRALSRSSGKTPLPTILTDARPSRAAQAGKTAFSWSRNGAALLGAAAVLAQLVAASYPNLRGPLQVLIDVIGRLGGAP